MYIRSKNDNSQSIADMLQSLCIAIPHYPYSLGIFVKVYYNSHGSYMIPFISHTSSTIMILLGNETFKSTHAI